MPTVRGAVGDGGGRCRIISLPCGVDRLIKRLLLLLLLGYAKFSSRASFGKLLINQSTIDWVDPVFIALRSQKTFANFLAQRRESFVVLGAKRCEHGEEFISLIAIHFSEANI